MKIRMRGSALRQTSWDEYLIRFVFGGLMTMTAGLIARSYGPVIGGLFLAFPAVFAASSTLIEKHERQKKQRAGCRPGFRGTDAAALDAAGAAIGSAGMLAFAVLVWRFLPDRNAPLVLFAATLAWFVVAFVAWRIGESN